LHLQEKRNRKGKNVEVAIAVGKLVAEKVKGWDRSGNISIEEVTCITVVLNH
jgi:ribosomal protein L18